MHIPDGFISPQTYIPSYILCTFMWFYSGYKAKKKINIEIIPFLSTFTAFSFILMTILVPIPFGTTAHALGIGPLTLLFGPHISFLCISLVLLIQSLFFGIGGITTLPVNALSIGFFGSFSLYIIFKILKKFKNINIIFSTFIAVIISAFVLSIFLGIQPILAHDIRGKPLYFPYKLNVTIPAMLLPHIFVGIAESVITLISVKIIRKIGKIEIVNRED